MQSTPIFFFRVCTNKGLGHIKRCINFSKELKSVGKKIHFFIDDCDHNLKRYIKKNISNFFIIEKNLPKNKEINFIIKKIKKFPNNIFVIDDYKCNVNYQKKISNYTTNLIIIDDNIDYKKYYCDVIINPNQNIAIKKYKRFLIKKTKILHGKRISLIKEHAIFLKKKIKKIRYQFSGIKKILISFGGNSHLKYIKISLKAILETKLDNLTIYVTSKKKIKNYFSRQRKIKIVPIYNIFDLNYYYIKSDICIGSCGHSSWERINNLLPSICIILSKNQNIIANNLKKKMLGFVTHAKSADIINNFIKKKLISLNDDESFYRYIIDNLSKISFKNTLKNIINRI